MSNIKTLGILLVFLSASPVLADEASEYLDVDYCLSLTYNETDNIDFPGEMDHGPTFMLPHGSILEIEPFYDMYDAPYALPGDLPSHQGAVRNWTDVGCTVDFLPGKYETTRVSCPAKKEMHWVFSSSERKDTIIYGSITNLNEEDRPRYDAIINSLVIYTKAECDQRKARP